MTGWKRIDKIKTQGGSTGWPSGAGVRRAPQPRASWPVGQAIARHPMVFIGVRLADKGFAQRRGDALEGQ